jgi:hypothetical protein
MSARDDRLAEQSADAKRKRAVAEARREWLEANPDPATGPDARARRYADSIGLDSPLRRPMTRKEQARMRSPGGKSIT